MDKYTDDALLKELIKRNTLRKAPKKREFLGEGWKSVLIGIGTDFSVEIDIHDDDLEALGL